MKPSPSRRRPRYIVVTYAPARQGIRHAIARVSWRIGPPKLIEASEGVGIVRTWHLDTQEMIQRLNSIEGLRTMKTSGTLRKAREIAQRMRAAHI
ncbi:MAG: hypothetical protein AB1665_06880 [Candidatus Thermoplasmatota archaeon]